MVSRFSTTLAALLALIAAIGGAGPAQAVVVFKIGDDKPVMGFLVSEDETRVIVKRVLPDGRTRDVVLLRSEIQNLIHTVDRERLSKLRHDAPKAYRDYAEELAEKRQDPEARATALRLYLISVWLDRGLARSSMLGMIALARSPEEELRFRALAYLLDEDHDERLLKTPQVTVDAPRNLDAPTTENIIKLVRLVREGRGEQAKSLLYDAAVRKGLEQFDEYVSTTEIQTAASGGFVSPSLLYKLVTIELSLSRPVAGAAETAKTNAVSSWQQGARQNGFRPLPVLTLETVTEFDPRACRYRDGKWVNPESE